MLTLGTHASTFGGTPLACAAGLAVFEAFDKDKVLLNAAEQGNYVMSKIAEMRSRYPFIKEVRGMGCMIGVDLGDKIKDAVAACRRNYFLVLSAGETVLRLMPPLTMTREVADEALALLDKSFSSLA